MLEVRPPIKIDKGAGIRRLLDEVGSEIGAAIYVGDDTTDLDAFRTLSELVAEGRLVRAVRVGVSSSESPTEIAEAADLVVDGPDGVSRLLAALIATADE